MKHRLIWIVLLPFLSLAWASAFTQTLQPSQQIDPDLIIIKVNWNNYADLHWLKSAFDVWQVVPDSQIAYIAAEDDTVSYLNSLGWQVEVDLAQTDFHLQRPLQFATEQREPESFFGGYKNNVEILAELQALNAAYPDLTELFDYGDSLCKVEAGCTTPGGDTLAGHDLFALRITNEAISGTSQISGTEIISGSKPIFMFHSGVHSREIATPEIALRFARWLLESYQSDVQAGAIIDWQESWIIPVANPDGYDLVVLGADSQYGGVPLLHRKNGRDVALNTCSWPSSASNHSGVDLNRNHSFGWGPIGTSLSPCSQIYRGEAGASEPETLAFEQLISSLIPDQRGPNRTDAAPADTSGLMVTMHSYGEVVIWSWGDGIFPNNIAPNHNDLKAIGDRLALSAGYQSLQGNDFGGVSGATDDHVYGELGIPSFTFEVGTTFLQSYEETISTLWDDNRPTLLLAASIASAPYKMIHGPEISNLTHTVSGSMIIITGTVSDVNNGNNLISTVIAGTTFPISTTANITGTAVDSMFDSTTEQFVIGPIPFEHPTGEPKGCTTTIYLHGIDQEGALGAINGIIATPKNCLLTTYFPFTLQDS